MSDRYLHSTTQTETVRHKHPAMFVCLFVCLPHAGRNAPQHPDQLDDGELTVIFLQDGRDRQETAGSNGLIEQGWIRADSLASYAEGGTIRSSRHVEPLGELFL